MRIAQVASPDVPNNSGSQRESRCEVERTLRGGQCELPGVIEVGGALLCARHAKEVEVHERIALLQGIVLTLGLCLRAFSLRRDRNRTLQLRCSRERATRELALAYEDLCSLESNGP